MKAYQADIAKFTDAETQVFGISVDSVPALKRWSEELAPETKGLTFPLLSDWGGEVTRDYGIYVDQYKAARRVDFLIGKDGKILEEQIDKDAIDPTKIVDACQRPPLKN